MKSCQPSHTLKTGRIPRRTSVLGWGSSHTSIARKVDGLNEYTQQDMERVRRPQSQCAFSGCYSWQLERDTHLYIYSIYIVYSIYICICYILFMIYVYIRAKRMCCPRTLGSIHWEAKKRGRREDFGHWGSCFHAWELGP